MASILSNECIKIGFILTDYLVDIHTKLGCNNFKAPTKAETTLPVVRPQSFLKTSIKSDNAIPVSTDNPKTKKLTKIDINLLKYFKDISFK